VSKMNEHVSEPKDKHYIYLYSTKPHPQSVALLQCTLVQIAVFILDFPGSINYVHMPMG